VDIDLYDRLEDLPTSRSAEEAYNRITRYRFAQRYAEARSVACVSRDDVGFGTRLLAETGEFVVGFSNSTEALQSARGSYPDSNVNYKEANLPELPCAKGRFDVVVALDGIETLEPPEQLIIEAKRVLKQDGVLIVSAADKHSYLNGRNHGNSDNKGGMYAPELEEMLGRHFGRVYLYRQGAVAGACVFRNPGDMAAASVESTVFYSSSISFESAPPATNYFMAVCSNTVISHAEDGQPYLLLDRERYVYDESDDQRQDIQALKDEIQQMQETEVQAFQDTLAIRNSENGYLRAQLAGAESRLRETEKRLREARSRQEKTEKRLIETRSRQEKTEKRLLETRSRQEKTEKRLLETESKLKRVRERLEARNRILEEHVHNLESSRTWRMLESYRRARIKLNALVGK
jgi:SAM-dependent methyltransferase